MTKFSTCSNAGKEMRNMGNMEAQDLLQALLRFGRTLDCETGFSATTLFKMQKKVQESYEAWLNHFGLR